MGAWRAGASCADPARCRFASERRYDRRRGSTRSQRGRTRREDGCAYRYFDKGGPAGRQRRAGCLCICARGKSWGVQLEMAESRAGTVRTYLCWAVCATAHAGSRGWRETYGGGRQDWLGELLSGSERVRESAGVRDEQNAAGENEGLRASERVSTVASVDRWWSRAENSSDLAPVPARELSECAPLSPSLRVPRRVALCAQRARSPLESDWTHIRRRFPRYTLCPRRPHDVTRRASRTGARLEIEARAATWPLLLPPPALAAQPCSPPRPEEETVLWMNDGEQGFYTSPVAAEGAGSIEMCKQEDWEYTQVRRASSFLTSPISPISTRVLTCKCVRVDVYHAARRALCRHIGFPAGLSPVRGREPDGVHRTSPALCTIMAAHVRATTPAVEHAKLHTRGCDHAHHSPATRRIPYTPTRKRSTCRITPAHGFAPPAGFQLAHQDRARVFAHSTRSRSFKPAGGGTHSPCRAKATARPPAQEPAARAAAVPASGGRLPFPPLPRAKLFDFGSSPRRRAHAPHVPPSPHAVRRHPWIGRADAGV